MSGLYLARARLKRDGALAALAGLLLPAAEGARAAAAHRLVWALFPGVPDRARDFLWREEAPGRFLILTPHLPENPDGLFELEVKDFAPTLAAGDRLGFTLRANPVIARAAAHGRRGQRHDVVMDALNKLPKCQRAAARLPAVAEAGAAWLARVAATAGFAPLGPIGVDGYERVRLPRDSASPIVFGRLDITGHITVVDPALFLDRLAHGFGRARAFGCGLMLIRRA